MPGHVLVIDDDADATELMVTALEHGGWKVWVADDVDSAAERLRDKGPDVIVATLTQRGVAMTLARAGVTPAIVALSADERADADALVAGATAIVRTPVDAPSILAGVEAAVTSKIVSLPPQSDRERVIRCLVERTRASEARSKALERTDALTGLLDRRGLSGALSDEQRRSRRTEHQLSALLVDIDDFGAVNSDWGHGWGDTALRRVAHALVTTLREVDHVGRADGDAFLALLPETNDRDALRAGERVRTAIASTSLSHAGRDLKLTASVAVGPVMAGEGLDALLRRLYRELQRNGESDRVSG